MAYKKYLSLIYLLRKIFSIILNKIIAYNIVSLMGYNVTVFKYELFNKT